MVHYPPTWQRELAITLRAHEAMDEAWQALMRANAERNAATGEDLTVACAPGCAACCTYLVDTYSSEAALIAASVEESDAGYKRLVMERLLDWEYEFHHWLLRHPMPPKELGAGRDDPHDLWRGAWQARRIACPFLDMDNYRCSIYEDRPATCRGHHACYPPEEAKALMGVEDPPEGCFTKLEDVQVGHLTPIWQITADLNEVYSKLLVGALQAENIEVTGHMLPLLVLKEGRQRFGWPPPNPRKKRGKPPRLTVARKP